MTIEEIVKTWLKENGYDGLCDTDTECGCTLDDLMPCDGIGKYCEAGHREKAPDDSDFDTWVVPGKKE